MDLQIFGIHVQSGRQPYGRRVLSNIYDTDTARKNETHFEINRITPATQDSIISERSLLNYDLQV